MDESQTLDALANLLNQLSENPFNIALHAQHIHLVQSAEGMEGEVQSALEMVTNFLAAGDEVWIPLIDAKESSLDLDSTDGVQELLASYTRAEADYLSIPILKKHLDFLIGRHAKYSGDETKPDELGEIFSTAWSRSAIADVVNKGIGHLTQSHLLWDAQRDWEQEILDTAPKSEKESLIAHVESLYMNRLRQPHSNSDETFQSYSSFTTNYKPAQEYERLLVSASKLRSKALKSYERREPLENALTKSKGSLNDYARYIAAERRAKYPDLFIMRAVFERAIAEAARRRFVGEVGAEEALRSFWTGYCDVLRINGAKDIEMDTMKRATRSAPGSGEVWARYLRYLERASNSEEAPEDRETIGDVFTKAMDTNLLQADVEQIVPITVARAGFEKRRIEGGSTDEDAFTTLTGILTNGIEMVHRASPTGDPRFRLEKYLAEIYLHLASLPDNAIKVWHTTARHYKTSYLAWTSYTDLLIKHDQYDQARAIFKELHTKNLDWPEAIWEAWLSFENLFGSVEDIDSCLDKVEKAAYQLNARRAKEAGKASFQAMQMAVDQPASAGPVAQVAAQREQDTTEPPGADVPSAAERGTKRMADDMPSVESHKKAKIEPQQPLKRDRENCTVFVADLPVGVTEDELTQLFKDCGKVREVKITQLLNQLVATVEFFERDSIPAALTKDKKRIRGEEVAVHLAWKSTLYVTNFPERADDQFIRDLFGKFGTIFDVRWPSKKFKNTRRFCYVQYTSPTVAEIALQLHGQVLENGQTMQVFISNPERKKDRSDQDANEREIYVAGLSKFTTQADLQNLFKTYGGLKEVRMATEKDGSSKGFAFVEFEEEKNALAALNANNHELKKRRIAVTLADSRVRARNRNVTSETGLGRKAEARSRSIRIRNLPANTQEGLLQQVLEKIAPVKRVEVFADLKEAVVELQNAAEVGKLVLRTEAITFNGNTLKVTEEGIDGGPLRVVDPPTKTGGLFVPRRTVASRPRAGLGHARKSGTAAAEKQPQAVVTSQPSGSKSQQSKGQDDFRKMLGNG